MTVQDVLAAANQLSQKERLQVAIRLLESLKETYVDPKENAESALAWKTDLHPSVQRLVGAVSSGGENVQASYIDYLEEKYS